MAEATCVVLHHSIRCQQHAAPAPDGCQRSVPAYRSACQFASQVGFVTRQHTFKGNVQDAAQDGLLVVGRSEGLGGSVVPFYLRRPKVLLYYVT